MVGVEAASNALSGEDFGASLVHLRFPAELHLGIWTTNLVDRELRGVRRWTRPNGGARQRRKRPPTHAGQRAAARRDGDTNPPPRGDLSRRSCVIVGVPRA